MFIAAAGTGKTFCLDAAADAWQQTGNRIIGTALAATAAAQLQTQTGIPSDTIALRTIQSQEQPHFFDQHTILVVDEAAMAGTRDLAPLLDAAATAGAKVVLVGDPKQLDAINAGGLLRGIAQRIQPVTLAENRRQNELWERNALTQLRAGNASSAFNEYETHGRVLTAPTAVDIRDRMVADWHAATMQDKTTIMVAERNTDINDLNHRARQHLTATRQLRGRPLTVNDHDFKEGERVLCVKNNRRLGVRNGTVATITNIDHTKRAITIRTDAGDQHVLDAQYLDAGHLKYGYALTIHKSQGATVNHCLILGSDTLDANRGYTALSRGRNINRIYLVEQHEPDPEAHHPHREQTDPKAALVAALSIERADRLAVDHPALPRDVALNQYRQEIRYHYERAAVLYPIRDQIPADNAHQIKRLTADRQTLVAERDTARASLKTLQSERPTLFGRKEHSEAVTTAQARVASAEDATMNNGDELRETRRARVQRDAYLTKHAPQLTQLDAHERAINVGLDQLIERATKGSPTHISHKLGWPPPEPEHQQPWRAITRTIEDYRIRHNITHPLEPIGDPPANPKHHNEYTALHQKIQTYITQHNPPTRTIPQPATRVTPPTVPHEQPVQRRRGPELGL